MSTDTAIVNYASGQRGQMPTIDFAGTGGGAWQPVVAHGDTQTFEMKQSPSSEGFEFIGLTIWYGDESSSQVAETFLSPSDESAATYLGVTVDKITASTTDAGSTLKFTVTNGCTVKGQPLTLDFEVLIQTPDGSFLTSRDPQITLDPET